MILCGSEERSVKVAMQTVTDVVPNLVAWERLELLDVLGAGGFGSVHFAAYEGQTVAVKRCHRRLTTQHVEASFRAELAAATLRHENIVRVLGVCIDHVPADSDQLPLLVMEFAGDRDLQRVIEDVAHEPMPPRRRLRFAADICAALEHVHSRGFLHLDVKPANVLVTPDDRCKLADFGCSLELSSEGSDSPVTPTKSSMTGTFAYRAPELLRGKPPTDKADVYSLAICLWQLLTRERPYRNEEHQVVIFAVVAYNLRPDLPPCSDDTSSYHRIVRHCWEPEPENRPSAAEALLRLRAEITAESLAGP